MFDKVHPSQHSDNKQRSMFAPISGGTEADYVEVTCRLHPRGGPALVTGSLSSTEPNELDLKALSWTVERNTAMYNIKDVYRSLQNAISNWRGRTKVHSHRCTPRHNRFVSETGVSVSLSAQQRSDTRNGYSV